MTEDSQRRMRGYGPFQEGAEPPAQIAAASQAASMAAGNAAADQPIPDRRGTQPAGALDPGRAADSPHDGAQLMSPGPSEAPRLTAPVGPHFTGPAAPHADGRPFAGDAANGRPVTDDGFDSMGLPPSSGGPYFTGSAAPQSADTGLDAMGLARAKAGPHFTAQPGAQPITGDSTGLPPTSGGPRFTAQPTTGDLTAPPPTSGGPYFTAQPTGDFPAPPPTSGGPYSAGLQPTSGDPYSPQGGYPAPGRRIEPSPPPQRSRLLIGILAGLAAGLLLFGTGGYVVGQSRVAKPVPAPSTPEPTPSDELGVFEQSQVALNQTHFPSEQLATLSQGWLPRLSSCLRDGETGGPSLNAGEKARVRCTLSGMSVIFVEYASIVDRDKAQVKALGQNVDARALTPGVGAATQRAAPSGRTTGNYVEYAYKLTEGGNTRTVAGIWWDDARTPTAAYLLAYWADGVGQSWEPMRDLWSRYA
ncbi:hypothetical protein ACWKSP_10715 [Micromonosporaceae bacterium Da 78-11]